MIPIPGILIAIVSFPGVIVHEAAHLIFCKLRKVAVFDVCYFRVGNPAGYVIHEPVSDFTTSLLITMGPFIVNSLLCILFCFPAFFPMRVFGRQDFLSYFWMWLGISIGMHAFPSTQDATNLWNQAKAEVAKKNPIAVVGFPLVVLIFIGNILSFFWLDVAYGVALGWGLPALIFKGLT